MEDLNQKQNDYNVGNDKGERHIAGVMKVKVEVNGNGCVHNSHVSIITQPFKRHMI